MDFKRPFLLFLLFFIFVSIVSLSSSKGESESNRLGHLEEIILTRSTSTLEVKILFDLYTSHRRFMLEDPNKIVIDFPNIEDIQTDRYFEINDFGIQRIRAGMFKTDIARVVFDLKAGIPPYKIERIQRGIKVTFSLSEEKVGPSQRGFLKRFIFSRTQDTFEIKILFDLYTSHRRSVLENPNKIIIDFPNIEGIHTYSYFDVNDFGIRRIRAEMFKSDMVRVVFDLKAEIPPYKIEGVHRGIKVTFWPVERPEVEEEEMLPEEEPEEEEILPEREPEEELDEKAVMEKEEQPAAVSRREPSQRREDEIRESLDKTGDQPEETKEILEKLTAVLYEIQDEKRIEKKQFIRIEALGGAFQPGEKTLRDVYETGLFYGAGLNFGIWEFAELWIAQKYFSKKIIHEVTGEERRINLVPLEGGLKFRLNKGVVNPYFGFGASYYQYKEINLAEEIKDKNIGYVGLAGVFFKLKGGLIFDIHAHYSFCLVSSGEEKLNVGGFYIGAGLGFEY